MSVPPPVVSGNGDGPPPALMAMMRAMADAKAAASGTTTSAERSDDGAVIGAVAQASAEPSPTSGSSSSDTRWSAQTSWIMACGDGQGLQLVICEDDATERAELAAATGALPSSGGAAQRRLPTRLDPDLQGGSSALPCELILGAEPPARILRLGVVTSVQSLELFVLPPVGSEASLCPCENRPLPALANMPHKMYLCLHAGKSIVVPCATGELAEIADTACSHLWTCF
jgi:hypothetical protein